MNVALLRLGSTPTHIFSPMVRDENNKIIPLPLELIKECLITYQQNGENKIVKRLADTEAVDGKLMLKLSQEETLSFNDRDEIKLEIKILTTGGDAIPSVIYELSVGGCLNREVM